MIYSLRKGTLINGLPLYVVSVYSVYFLDLKIVSVTVSNKDYCSLGFKRDAQTVHNEQ
jgi:hypothetical protein